MPKPALQKAPRKRQVNLEFRAPARPILEAQWKTAFGRPLPLKIRRPLAVQVLRLYAQEAAHGGLAAEIEAYLASLLPKPRGRGPQAAPMPVRRLKPGTRLLRAWRGKTYTVTVADQGFDYEGQRFSSLSVIAREITGTPWSGPVFFGLKKAQAAKEAL